MTIKNRPLKVLLGMIAFLPAFAFADGYAVETGGFGKWVLDALFEAGSAANPAEGPGLIGSLAIPLNLMCLVITCLLLTAKAIQYLLVTASKADASQSPISLVWAPIHTVLAVALMTPTLSGYSLGQYAGLWVGERSNDLGNLTLTAGVSSIKNGVPITAPPVPAVNNLVIAMVESQVCMERYNLRAEFTEAAARSGGISRVQAVASQGGVAVDGKVENRIEYQLTNGREFLTTSASQQPLCGYVATYQNVPAGAESDQINNIVSGESIGSCDSFFSAGCMLSSVNQRAATHNLVVTAQQNVNSALRDVSGNLDDVVRLLIYDEQAYYQSLLDQADSTKAVLRDDLMAKEDEQIDLAARIMVEKIRSARTKMFQAYGDAISKYKNHRNDKNDAWYDTLMKIGWPALGGFWWQATNQNKELMDQFNLQSVAIGPNYQGLDQDQGDDQRVTIINERIKKFQQAVKTKLRNTSMDTASLSDEGKESANATELRDSFSLMTDDMMDHALTGVGDPSSMGEWLKVKLSSLAKQGLLWTVKKMREDEANAFSTLVNTGHWIVGITEMMYVPYVVAESYAKAAEEAGKKLARAGDYSDGGEEKKEGLISRGINYVKGAVGTWLGLKSLTVIYSIQQVISDAGSLWKYVFIGGLFLAFYVAAAPLAMWLIGFVSWLIYICEAILIIPLWGILFAGDAGSETFAPERAKQGFIHLLSILFHPALMVTGLFIGIKVIDLISFFILDWLVIGFMGATEGSMFGVLSLLFGLIFAGIIAYQILMRILDLALEFTDRAISWIGSRQGFGDTNTERSSRSAFVGVIGDAKHHARRSGTTPKIQANNPNNKMGLKKG